MKTMKTDGLFWQQQMPAILNDAKFQGEMLNGLCRVEQLGKYTTEFIVQRLVKAFEVINNDLETMVEGETRIFNINSRHDVYKINRKIQNIYKKMERDVGFPRYSFRRRSYDDKFLRVHRAFNIEDMPGDI